MNMQKDIDYVKGKYPKANIKDIGYTKTNHVQMYQIWEIEDKGKHYGLICTELTPERAWAQAASLIRRGRYVG